MLDEPFSEMRGDRKVTSEASTSELLQRLVRGRTPLIATLVLLRGRDDLVAQALEYVREGEEGSRAMALVALRKAATPAELDAGDAWPALHAALADPSARVRALAARVLAGHARAAEALVAALGDAEPSVRNAAAEALLLLDRTQALVAFQSRLAREDTNGRVALLGALARNLTDSTPLEAEQRPALIDLARAGLEDRAASVREAAATVLGRVPGTANEALLLALRDEAEPVRVAAAVGLLADAARVPTAPLVTALGDPSPRVRGCVLMVLGEGRHVDACAAIRRLLADSSVRSAAIRALGQLGCTEAGPDLVALVGSGPPRERIDAIEALHRIEPSSSIPHPAIVAALDDSAPGVRRAAVSASAGVPSLLSRLSRALLHDGDPQVRRAAVLAISRIDGPEAGDALLSALGDRAEEVSVAALDHLGASHVRDPQPLLAGLDHPRVRVRAAVVRCVGRLSISAALARLRAMDGEGSSAELHAAVQWAWRRLEPRVLPPLPESIRRISDPGGRGTPSTVWYPRVSTYRPLEYLVCHLTGVIEAVDADEVTRWQAQADGDDLLVQSEDGRSCRIGYSLEPADLPGFAPGFLLRPSADPFFGHASPRFYAPDPGRAEEG